MVGRPGPGVWLVGLWGSGSGSWGGRTYLDDMVLVGGWVSVEVEVRDGDMWVVES